MKVEEVATEKNNRCNIICRYESKMPALCYEKFKSPDSKYRPLLCWCWLGEITEGTITNQLDELKSKGFYEVLIYPGFGMTVPYLSSRYLDLVAFAVKQAARLKMKVWLYDEYNWPSGTAAGKVLRDHPEYRMVYLKHFCRRVRRTDEKREIRFSLPAGEVICAQAIAKGKKLIKELHTKVKATNVRHLAWLAPAGDWEIVVFVKIACQSKLPFTVGEAWVEPVDGYVDTLNRKAISKFVKYTHEEYRRRLGKYFGNVIKGIFTDEPSSCRPHGKALETGWHKATTTALPWSDELPKTFKRLKKYDILPMLPDLILDTPTAPKTRKDYWEVVTHMYERAYFRQIGTWCDKQGIQFLGHPLFEEPLASMLFYQGDFFQTQRHFHIPGIDNIFGRYGFDENKGEYGSEPIACKLASSTAHQRSTGVVAGAVSDEPQRVICETFAVSPDDYTLEDMYRMTDWLEVFGVNAVLVVGYPSVGNYAPQDGTKFHNLRKYFTSEQIHHYSDYVARLSFMLTLGVHKASIGVLFPTSTYWMRNNRSFLGNSQWQRMERGFDKLSIALLRHQLDFDYIFEPSLLEARFRDGHLAIGKEQFSTILIPPVNMLPARIKRKLSFFIHRGGNVLAYAPLTDLEDIGATKSLPELITKLESEKTVKVEHQGKPNTDIVYHQRSIENHDIYFVLNSGNKNLEDVSLTFSGSGRPEMWNLRDGTIASIDHAADHGKIRVSLSFLQYQSYLIVISRSKTSAVCNR